MVWHGDLVIGPGPPFYFPTRMVASGADKPSTRGQHVVRDRPTRLKQAHEG